MEDLIYFGVLALLALVCAYNLVVLAWARPPLRENMTTLRRQVRRARQSGDAEEFWRLTRRLADNLAEHERRMNHMFPHCLRPETHFQEEAREPLPHETSEKERA